MLRKAWTARSFAAVALALSASTVHAQNIRPGSLLVFPEYDTRPGHVTVLTVTNTASGVGPGQIDVLYTYVDADDCLRFDRNEFFTPSDTLSVSVLQHNPQPGRGFVYAHAQDAITNRPVAHNFLVGAVAHLDGLASRSYSLNAFAFGSPQLPGALTDLDDDGVRDLDGLEYTECADQLVVPHFFGQTPGVPGTELILIALVGGQFKSRVDFLIYNDNEQVFSARVRMKCWSKGPLSAISPAFGNAFLAASADDPGEQLPSGLESGWFLLDGFDAQSSTTTILDPVILAVLVDTITMPTSELPFLIGGQPNGDLFPGGAAGDP